MAKGRNSIGSGSGAGPRLGSRGDIIDHVQRKLDEQQNASDAANAGQSNRGFRRWPFRVGAVAVTFGDAASRSTTETKMVTRDISPLGIGLLHSAYMHVGTDVVVEMPTISGGVVKLSGSVVRCDHVTGTVHKIGINFDEEIDPSHFEASILTSQRFAHERKLQGTVLHVEDCMVDRLLIGKQLREAGLKVTSVGTLDEARKAASRVWSLILCDGILPDGRATDFANELRAICNFTPFVVLTADDTPQSKEEFLACPADAVLYKPVSPHVLRNAIASMLKAPARDGTVISSLSPSDEGYGIVNEYVETLREQGRLLHESWMARDAEACRKIGSTIAASAAPYGFAPIGNEASQMEGHMAKASWTADASAAVRRVIALCQQVRTAEDDAERSEAA